MKNILLFIFILISTTHLLAQQNTCALAATNTIAIPYTETNGTTCGATSDFNNQIYCGAMSTQMPDKFYSFIATSTSMKITLTNVVFQGAKPLTAAQNVYLGLFSACPKTAGGCMLNASDQALSGSNGTYSEVRIWAQDRFVVGKQYYVVVDGDYPFAGCFNYDLKIENMDFSPNNTQTTCTNSNFELGNFSGWTGWIGNNPLAPNSEWDHSWTGKPTASPNGGAWTNTIVTSGINASLTNTASRVSIMNGSAFDVYGGFPVVPVGTGSYTARIGNASSNDNEMDRLARKFTVDASNTLLEFQYAVVWEYIPKPRPKSAGYFDISIYGPDGEVISCYNNFQLGDFPGTLPPSIKTSTLSVLAFQYRYKNWTKERVNLANYIGKEVTIVVTAADGSAGSFCYGYFDVNCGSSNTFSVETNKFLCKINTPITLVAPSGYSDYLWSPSGATTETISVSAVGVYSLSLSSLNSCGAEPLIYTVGDLSSVSANFTSTFTCINKTANFNNTTTGVPSGSFTPAYLWSFGDGNTSSSQNPTHVYSSTSPVTTTLNVTIANCDFNISKQLLIKTPTLSITNSTPAKCYGASNGSLTVNAIGGASPYSYTWSPSGGNGSVSNGLIAGNYTVGVTNGDNCVATITASIAQPSVPVTASISQLNTAIAKCSKNTGSITGITIKSAINPITYTWKDSTNTVVGSDLDLLNVFGGKYTLSVVDANGCSTSNLIGPINVPSTNSVSANFMANPLKGEIPLAVTFSNTSIGATKYIWDFGTGDSSKIMNPSFTYTALGKFKTCLIASNADLCSDSVCAEIDVIIKPLFIIPNVFTPNDDGANDVFKVRSIALKTLDVEIYNRWGQPMYEYHTIDGSWDGKSPNGEIAPSGTYFYKIKATDIYGLEYPEVGKTATGSFQLIR